MKQANNPEIQDVRSSLDSTVFGIRLANNMHVKLPPNFLNCFYQCDSLLWSRYNNLKAYRVSCSSNLFVNFLTKISNYSTVFYLVRIKPYLDRARFIFIAPK